MDILLYFSIMDGPELPPDEVLRERTRSERDQLLAGSDWTQLPDVPVNRDVWAAYRQELRDAPDTWIPGPVWQAPDPPS